MGSFLREGGKKPEKDDKEVREGHREDKTGPQTVAGFAER